jgi:hypothetical protein
MRNIMGSWPFVFSFFGVMIIWATLNTYFLQRVIHHKAFDPYPYILLNLFLSMLAGVQAAALLIAAKRADSISSEIALHTVKNTDDIKVLLGKYVPDRRGEEADRPPRGDPPSPECTLSRRGQLSAPNSRRRFSRTYAVAPSRSPRIPHDTRDDETFSREP